MLPLTLGLGGIALFAPVGCSDDKGPSAPSDGERCTIPTNFSWTSSEVLISPVSDADHDLVSIKDPTVVHFDGRWHVFATTANTDEEWSLAYLNFEEWEDAARADMIYMDATPGFEGYMAAPHVFFFAPHEKWYLVYQTQPPKYSTTDDIADPSSWSEPRSFFSGKPRSAPESWIDYWVICDDSDCYLFFTGDNGGFYRSRTSREDFPEGFDDPVLAMRMSQNELFEGSATYKIKGLDQYLTLVEAIGPEGVRYYKAWVSDALDGAWTPIANSFERPFAGEANVSFEGKAWTRDISHGELLRDGYDERMVVDLCNGKLQFLYQGQDHEAGQAASSYSQMPYRLGLLTQGPSDPELPPLGLPPTPAEPFPTTPTGDNLLTNPGFENGSEGWMAWGATLAIASDPVRGGESSGRVSNRSEAWHGAAQDIFSKVEPGQTYFASVWLTIGTEPMSTGAAGAGGAASDSPPEPISLTMKFTCGDAETYTSVASGQVREGEWVELSGTLDAPSCADLLELVLYAEGPAAGVDLYLDDASLSE